MSPRRLAVWPTLPPAAHSRPASDWRPFPLDQDRCRVYSLARHALWNACRSLGLRADDVVLVPAYHHGSEIEALLRVGVRIRYYEVDQALRPHPAELELLLERGVRALYLIHYLGFPQDAAWWREWCEERGLLLIEDAAQAFLATQGCRPLGSFGHVGLFCLYKTYGLPDGGTVISTPAPTRPTSAPRTGWWRVIKRHVAWLAERRAAIGAAHLQLGSMLNWWHTRRDRPNRDYELGDPSLPPSRMTMRLLPRLLDEGTAPQRREHYRFLLGRLGELVPAPFKNLPEGASPFAFPVETTQADRFLARLRHHGVIGLRFWLYPHPSLPVASFPRSHELRERTVALPVHQELTRSDLQQIVDAVKYAY